ncbi:MAG: iron-sulfur cluster carrier protein ApbC [Gammaproteobacteria bacterium]|nr:iron-sulfur cluster carrier protein ApbC [Gammaproteobacteria bacterium]
MSEVSQSQVEMAVKGYQCPYLNSDLVSASAVKDIAIDGAKVTLKVELGFPAEGYVETLAQALRNQIAKIDGVTDVVIEIASKIISHTVQRGIKPHDNIKNIIAIASGKGGVGKSTTSVNLALALVAEGARVGILDADIYGPSQPRMLGATARPQTEDGKTMLPVVCHDIQSMSIGYMIEEDNPMIWRGPMVTQALEQLLRDTNWDNLDYLVIDLPPGTGDVQLTLAQKIPVSAAVIVTTPQDIALLDARKALKMFEKVEVPVLGVIENMSTHICSECGHEEHIFGAGGGEQMATDYDVQLLGSLPLDITIRENVDVGTPTVVADPDGAIAQNYREIARRVAAGLSQQGKDYSTAFPNIVIKNT